MTAAALPRVPDAAALAAPWRARVAGEGFAFVPADAMAPLLRAADPASPPLADWSAFAASWERLEPDTYMADQGRYRRRRHAVFAQARGAPAVRGAHEPHWQDRVYNPLNGGVARWFAPMEDAIGGGASLRTILSAGEALFAPLAPAVARWRVEVHQFRIEARHGEPGLPTPEGRHRDGVDFVLVLMLARVNIASGTTTVHATDGRTLGEFTLTAPFDAALVDDRRVLHGVTPVEALDPARPAHRDVLVATWRRAA